jgi:hypothetical protein
LPASATTGIHATQPSLLPPANPNQ